jgi:iron(III) transport system substrate-binding protein
VRILAGLALALAAPGLAACGSDPASSAGIPAGGESAAGTGGAAGTLIIYSGRNENLVAPLLEQMEQAIGTPVEVRYGESAELAAQLLEEGEQTDADLFFSQDAGALGALARENRLTELEPAVLGEVPEPYRATDGSWVATSARARVIAYDPRKVPEADLPKGIDDVVDPRFAGAVGYAPTNASFQSFVTGLRVLRGEDGARSWLEAFAANEPVAFENNVQALDAVDSGDLQLALINHYYWFEKVAELGATNVTAKIEFLPGGDPGGLVNVAGVGILTGSDQAEAATEAATYLLSDPAQQYFADATAEYPVRAGITSIVHDLPPLSSLQAPALDLSDLDTLAQTLSLLDEVGLT